MRIVSKGITEMAGIAGKMCRAAYDSGVTWEKIAIDACTRYLMEEQRAELYASANAALFDKLTAATAPKESYRPGDPRAALGLKLPEGYRDCGDVFVMGPPPDITQRVRIRQDVCVHSMNYKLGRDRFCSLCAEENTLFPGTPKGKPYPETTGYSPATPTTDKLPSNGLCHYDYPRLTTYDPTPEARAASDQALRRIAEETAPGMTAD